jgi:CHAT domain-containing protein
MLTEYGRALPDWCRLQWFAKIALLLGLLTSVSAQADWSALRDLRELTSNPSSRIQPKLPVMLNGENEWLQAVINASRPEDLKDLVGRIKLDGASFDQQLSMAAAASAGGANEMASKALLAAGRLVPPGSSKRRRLLLLVQSLHRFHMNDRGALVDARTACGAPAPTGIDALCARVLALVASQSSNRTETDQALQALRKYTNNSLDRFDPPHSSDVELDVVNVLYFGILRERYDERASSWSSDKLEWMVTAMQLKQLESAMVRDGPTSPKAWREFMNVVNTQSMRGRYDNVRVLLTLYDASVLRRYASKYEDLEERQFKVNALLASALIRTGNLDAARARLDAAERFADSDSDHRRRILKRLFVADAVDIPSNPDTAIALYQGLIQLMASEPRPPSLFSEYNSLTFDERLAYFKGLGFESNELTFGDRFPLSLLEFTARFRLVSLYAAQGDLRKYDEAYALARQQAVQTDSELKLPVLTTLLEVARADAVLKFGPTPERLAEAEKALLEAQARIDPAMYPNEDPRPLQMTWQWSGRLLEPGVRSADQSIPIRDRLLGRIARVLGQIALAEGRYDRSATLLEKGIEALMREYMVGGRPNIQSAMAIGLSRSEEALGDPEKARKWAREATLGLAVVNSNSVEFADALSVTANSAMRRADEFGAELTICRAISIRASHALTGDSHLAEDFFTLARILLEQHDVDAAERTADHGLTELRSRRSETWSPQSRQAAAAYLDTAYTKVGGDLNAYSALWEKAFSLAQDLMTSQAGMALVRARSRGTTEDPQIARLIQERDELEYEFGALDARFAVLFAPDLSEKDKSERDGKISAERAKNIVRVREIRARLSQIDARLQQLDPKGGTGTSRQGASTVSPATIIDHLNADQALIVFLEASPSTYVWYFSKAEGPRWRRAGMPSAGIAMAVDTLRCGLDVSSWTAGAAFCRGNAGVGSSDGPETMPYRLDIAFLLYKALFAGFEGKIAGKEIIVTASGPLATLPLGALVTRKPDQAIYRLSDRGNPEWLARQSKLTFSPLLAPRASGSAGTGLRRSNLLLAFGDPAISGPKCDKRAWDATLCSPQRHFDNWCPDTSARSRSEQVRRLEPRPGTANEICQIAESHGVRSSKVFLAGDATLANFRELNATSSLADASVIVFATHGIVPRVDTELESSIIEPALVLTPRKPAVGAPDDDGLLFASEIALSRINADLVILSACNSAGRDRQTGEGFAGLSRAFLFAGAKSLLVSQWEATVFASNRYAVALASEAGAPAGRKAEILRDSELSLISENKGAYSHPSIWAPYMLVREY